MPRRRTKICLAILLSTLVGCNGGYNSGDRVLVDKFAYDFGIGHPRRFEVVVFKFPPGPVENGVPKNYIKRLLGLPGELLAIFFGQIFVYQPDATESADFDDEGKIGPDGKPFDPNYLWTKSHMHVDSDAAMKLFNTPGKFKIVRKPPEVMLAERRIVNDNDFQPTDCLAEFPVRDGPPRLISKRWVRHNRSDWTSDDAKGFVHPGTKRNDVDWLTYQNIIRPRGPNPEAKELITDFMDYNFPINRQGVILREPELNWDGDLMLECELNVLKPEGEFRLELSRGIFRYQARFDLSTGDCKLFRIHKDGKEVHMDGASASTRVKGPGRYSLRLANFDARLTLWVDDDLPFGNGYEYSPPEILAVGENLDHAQFAERRGPYAPNDLEKPASFGSRGADVKIHHLRVWRDTYYSLRPGLNDDETLPSADNQAGREARRQVLEPLWRTPEKWGPLRELKPLVMYVQPGHFLCLGDNSPMSSDSRAFDKDWGVVPQRLLLGRALMVYFPLNRAGPIR